VASRRVKGTEGIEGTAEDAEKDAEALRPPMNTDEHR
jgi:hypothetical protein